MARSLMSLGTVLIAASTPFFACSSSNDATTGGDGDSGSSGDSSVGTNDSGSDANSKADASSPDGGADAAKPIELDLTGCPQSGYNAPFSIGGSTFALTVDTGSSDIGVVSSTCANCTGITPVYTPGASATDQHQTGGVSYASGQSWTGEIYSDTFSPGAALSPQTKLVKINSQTNFFESASCGFGTIPVAYQGIAGFGVASSATSGVDAPMKALTGAGMPNIFSLALCGLGGKMWLGGFDAASASAAPIYTPLLGGFFYNIKLDDFSVGATALGLTAASIGEVDIDSNTTELELPQSVYNALKAAIGNDSAFTAHFGGPSFFANGDCIVPLDGTPPTPDALDAALPTITMMLDEGAGASVPLTLKATTSYLEPITVSGVTKYCPEIEPSGSSSTIIGSSFVRSQVAIYDIAGSRIGFAPYAGCATR